MSWTAYDDPAVARKMTAGALQELARWVGGDREFHEPWKVFVRFMKYFDMPTYHAPRDLLDVGCAAGYYRSIIRTALSSYWNYDGVERSSALRHLAFDIFGTRPYPTIDLASLAFSTISSNGPPITHKWTVVLSGSMLQHVEDWKSALSEQMRVCNRWLIIHKIPVAASEVEHHTKTAYGVEMDEWHFPVEVINERVGKTPVMEHYFHSNPPHWSGLYDLGT